MSSGASAARDGADARYAARSGAVQVLTIIAQALIAASQVVFARLYGKAVYGAYLSALALLEVFSRGGVAGADKAMLRYVAAFRSSGDEAGVRSALGTGLRLALGVSGLLALGIAVGAPALAAALRAPALAPALRILAPLPVLMAVLFIVIQASLAARVTRTNFFVRGLAEPSLLLAAGVLAWLLGGGLRGLATAHLAAYSVTLAIAVVAARRNFRPAERTALFAAPRLRGFTRFAAPMALGEMLNAVVQRADMLILTALRGPEAAALYGAAELVTRAISNIRYAFDSIVAGVLSEAHHARDLQRLRYNLAMSVRWVVSVAAPIAATVIMLRAELLSLLFGSTYLAATGVLAVLALGHLLNSSFGLTGWALMVAGRSRLGLINQVLAVAFNLPAAYFLTGRYGPVGAALAALGAGVILQGAMLIESAVFEHVHPFSWALVKPLVATAAALGVEALAHGTALPPAARVAVVAIAGFATYGLVLLALGLPPEERRILRRIVATARGRASADGAA
jgi:O-antigen/teichoic acid export membrane protein